MSTHHTSRRAERGQVTAEYAVGLLGAVTIATLIFGPDASFVLKLRDVAEHVFERAFSIPLPDLFRWRR